MHDVERLEIAQKEIRRLRNVVRTMSDLLNRIAHAWNKKKYISSDINDELNEYME